MQNYSIALLSVSVVLLGFAETLLGQSNPTHDSRMFGMIFLIAGLLAAVASIVLLVLTLRERPRLVVGDPLILPVRLLNQQSISGFATIPSGTSVSPDTSGATGAVGQAGVFSTSDAFINVATPSHPAPDPSLLYASYLAVRNKPKSGFVKARATHVNLEYTRADDVAPPLELSARWSFRPQSVEYETTMLPSQVNIPANDAPYRFDVAVMFDGGDQIYAVDETSRFRGWNQYPLGPGPVLIKVTVQSSNAKTLKATFRATLRSTKDGIDLVKERDVSTSSVQSNLVGNTQAETPGWMIRLTRKVSASLGRRSLC